MDHLNSSSEKLNVTHKQKQYFVIEIYKQNSH